MRRLNPETGKPFKSGDLREDGFIFKTYIPSQVKKDGFFVEDWRSPKAFENVKKIGARVQAKSSLTFRGRGVQMLARSRNRAKKSSIAHSIVLEDILPGIEAGFCQLTKLPFDLKPVTKTSQNPYSPSIDRIDSLKGYTKDNIRIVLYAVNAALGQYGTETMLPILKAMITGIENVKKKSTTPVSKGTNRKSALNSKHGVVSLPRLGEIGDSIDDHSRTDGGQDVNHCTQESSGDSMGCRGEKMATLVALARIESNGEPDAETVRLEYKGRYILD